MTLSTSAVAVCCCKNSVSSRVRAFSASNRRPFSIAITAWSAKVFSKSMCPWAKRPDSLRVMTIAPIGAPSRNIGTARMLRHPPAVVTSRVYCGSAGMSSICATARVRIARPEAWSTCGGRGYIRRSTSTASGGKLWSATI